MSSHAAKRVLLLAVLALLLPGCSSVRMAYQRLDWFVLYDVRNRITLTDEQAERLKGRVAELRRWHCENELDQYARWLRAVNEDVQSGKVDDRMIIARNAELERFWHRLMDESAAALSSLLPLLSDAQIEEYFQSLERDNRNLHAEIIEPPLPERRERIRQSAEQQLERWIGSLTASQRQALHAWSEEVAAEAAQMRMAARLAWQQEFRRMLEHRRADAAAFGRALHRLLREPEYAWPAEHVRYRSTRREQTLHLLADIGRTLTPAQRRHLARRAESWAGDFEALACRDTGRQ